MTEQGMHEELRDGAGDGDAAESVPAVLACVLGLGLAAGDGSRREQTWTTRTP